MLSHSVHTVSCSFSLPLLLDCGASCLLYCFQEAGKTSLEFPLPSSAILPGGENRLRCHPCPNVSPRWSAKQTVELPDRSLEGGAQAWGCLNRVQDEKRRIVLQHSSIYHFSPPLLPFVYQTVMCLPPCLKLLITSLATIQNFHLHTCSLYTLFWSWHADCHIYL